MPPSDLERLLTLHAQTSAGHWTRVGPSVYAGDRAEPIIQAVGRRARAHHDAAFVTMAHEALPALLEELAQLRATRGDP